MDKASGFSIGFNIILPIFIMMIALYVFIDNSKNIINQAFILIVLPISLLWLVASLTYFSRTIFYVLKYEIKSTWRKWVFSLVAILIIISFCAAELSKYEMLLIIPLILGTVDIIIFYWDDLKLYFSKK